MLFGSGAWLYARVSVLSRARRRVRRTLVSGWFDIKWSAEIWTVFRRETEGQSGERCVDLLRGHGSVEHARQQEWAGRRLAGRKSYCGLAERAFPRRVHAQDRRNSA